MVSITYTHKLFALASFVSERQTCEQQEHALFAQAVGGHLGLIIKLGVQTKLHVFLFFNQLILGIIYQGLCLPIMSRLAKSDFTLKRFTL